MSNNIYNILGKLKALTESAEPKVSAPTETVYESVEPQGDIMEAVRSLESKFAAFKEAKKAKPDFLDVDKDGDKAEPFKKAVKDKKAVDEGFEDKLEKAREKAAAKGKTKEKETDGKSNVRTVKGKSYGGSAQKDEKEKDDLDEGREFKSKEEFDASAKPGDYYHSAKGKVTKTDKGIKHERGASKEDDREDLDEVAPPGKKAERMVKHIKKGYADDGKLTKKEKGIAYATAWKAHNKGQVEEGVEFGDTIKNSKAELKKAKPAKLKESADLRKHPIYTTQEAWDHYAKELAEQDASASNIPAPSNNDPVTKELDEIAALAGLARAAAPAVATVATDKVMDKVLNDGEDEDDFPPPPPEEQFVLEGDSVMINGNPVNVNSIEVDGVNDWDRPDFADAYITYAEFADGTPLTDEELVQLENEHGDLVNQAAHDSVQGRADFMDEDIAVEGNEYTKARLDAIARGEDTFQVGGKTHRVTGDTSQEKSVKEAELNSMRRLAGLPEMESEEEIEEERDIEYVNTPREKTAPLSAAIPSGSDLHKAKRQDPQTANKAANPLEESLWKSYEEMIKTVKSK